MFITYSQIPALIKNFFNNVIKRPDDNLIILRIVFSLFFNKTDAKEFKHTEKKNNKNKLDFFNNDSSYYLYEIRLY